MICQLRQTAQQALDALEESLGMVDNLHCYGICMDAITALKAALEAPTPAEYAMGFAEGFNEGCRPEEGGAVLWGVFEGGNIHDHFYTREAAEEMAELKGTHAVVRPLYAHPYRSILTDDELEAFIKEKYKKTIFMPCAADKFSLGWYKKGFRDGESYTKEQS